MPPRPSKIRTPSLAASLDPRGTDLECTPQKHGTSRLPRNPLHDDVMKEERMKVLLACLVQDSRAPDEGNSYEFYNLYEPLARVASEVVLFDFFRMARDLGRGAMNRRLVETVRRERPDVAIFALFQDEFRSEAIREVGRYAPTVSYFLDDDWRHNFVDEWIPHFDFITTPRTATLHRYRIRGLTNVIYSPFGFNEARYRPTPVPVRHDVSFVGGGHPWRSWVIRHLRKAGIDVVAFGPFWPSGRLSQEEMIETFSASRINLNLSNSRQWDARYLLTTRRALRTTLRSPKNREQIKGRHYEIPACGGFQMTPYCEDLERHFEIGEEVVVYMDPDDLVDKIRFYLENESERRRIAEAGYRRAQRDHSATHRMKDLLAEVARRVELRPVGFPRSDT